jgi:alkylated DNA repair dioxygenase AlkB
MPQPVAALAELCAAHAGHGFDNCLLNFYASGRNTMGFHYDAYDQLAPASWIAIVSLGAARPLVFRSADKLHLHQVTLEPGSLLLMDRATQDAWLHAIPRTPGAGPRISATFRQVVPTAPA